MKLLWSRDEDFDYDGKFLRVSKGFAMPKPQQEVLIRRAERFAALSPEQKSVVVQQLQAWNHLPQERRGAIGLALRRLQPLSEEERRKVVNGDEFKSRFSPEEQKIIDHIWTLRRERATWDDIANLLNSRRAKPPSGAAWYAMTVRRIAQREG